MEGEEPERVRVRVIQFGPEVDWEEKEVDPLVLDTGVAGRKIGP